MFLNTVNDIKEEMKENLEMQGRNIDNMEQNLDKDYQSLRPELITSIMDAKDFQFLGGKFSTKKTKKLNMRTVKLVIWWHKQ